MNKSDHNQQTSGDTRAGKDTVLAHLRACELESAIYAIHKFRPVLEKSDFDPIIKSLQHKANHEALDGEIRLANRFRRQKKALEIFRDFGPDPEKLIPAVDLPENYSGKILVVLVSGGLTQGFICLRSGDSWHREILRNTVEEIRDLGFFSSHISQLGGAHLRFGEDDSIIIWGISQEFGSCDKEIAADLLRKAYPQKNIVIET